MADVRLIVGKRGSGKSCKLREWIRPEPRVLLYDTLHEKTYDEFTRVDRFDELCKILLSNPPIFRIAFTWDGTAGHELDFDRVCRAVYACRSLVFCVDEIDQFVSPMFIPRQLDKIVSLGRHRELSLWVATRRPKEIHPLIRSQVNQVVTFTQTEKADVDWMRQVMGDQALQAHELAPYQALTWTDVAAPVEKGA